MGMIGFGNVDLCAPTCWTTLPIETMCNPLQGRKVDSWPLECNHVARSRDQPVERCRLVPSKEKACEWVPSKLVSLWIPLNQAQNGPEGPSKKVNGKGGLS